MIKIIISVYIGLVLLAAGTAHAQFKVARVDDSKIVELHIADASVDFDREVLVLSGVTPTLCVETVKPALNLNRDFSQLYVQVFAHNGICMNPLTITGEYEVTIDLKAYFSQLNISSPISVEVVVQNTIQGTQSFQYEALPQAFYKFDQSLVGTIKKDHRTDTFYIENQNNRIQVLSRFNLEKYQDKFVSIKGLIPGEVTIGLGASKAPSQMVIGQLISLR
jgi:hypothetical protein